MSGNYSHDHLMIDCEAIGTDATKCPTLEWSYYRFDWERFKTRPYSLQELLDVIVKDKMHLADQVRNHGCSYDEVNLQWWLDKKDLRYVLKPTSQDLTVHEFLANLIRYCSPKGPAYWWSRSNTYDPIILWRLATSAGREKELGEYLAYWRVRDSRTFIDAKLDFAKNQNSFVPVQDSEYWARTFKQHDSRHDVAADILRFQALTRAEEGLEQVDR